MPEEKEANWYLEVVCKVIGPKEGPIVIGIEYQATTKELAQSIQNELAEYFKSKNL